MDRKAFLIGVLLVLAASAAASKMGRYPLSGIGRANGASAAAATATTGCTLPFTLPCTLGS